MGSSTSPSLSDSSPVAQSLARIHAEVSPLSSGAVATYIPELAKANPNWFGICLVTTNGSIYEAGDTAVPFTIQSISKPFVYGLALEDQGRTAVREKVGVEPTGDAFNSISLEPGTGRPRNPMINAGAIATTSLIEGKTPEVRQRRILEMMSLYAGRALSLDEAVYQSEAETGHRNRAIGHMLRNFDILTSDPIPVVDLYFRSCSISVNCHDLGIMAATLANRGVNPITGRQALRGEYVESVLSVMETCGMYDYAGQWIYEVGMPAKSGVSGGIIAVLPGQLGIAVYSPLLDSHGNSVRGIRVCQDLSRYLDLHLLNRGSVGRLAVRRRLTGTHYHSNRVRSTAELVALKEHGQRIQLFQLQGNLSFTTAETVVREVLGHAHDLRHLIIDFKRVLSINESSCYLLHQLVLQISERGVAVQFTHAEHLPALRRYLNVKLGTERDTALRQYPDTDRALEAAEDRLLAELTVATHGVDELLPLRGDHFPLLQNLSEAECDLIGRVAVRREFQPQEVLVETGAAAHEMFILVRGAVSVTLPQASGGPDRRLAAFRPGSSFGEMALLDRAPRSARIVADTDGAVYILTDEALRRIERENPALALQLLRNLCLIMSGRLREANAELAVLD